MLTRVHFIFTNIFLHAQLYYIRVLKRHQPSLFCFVFLAEQQSFLAMDPFCSYVDSSNLSIDFWGMVVKPGETRMVSPIVNQPIRLTQVTLKLKDQELPDHVPVYVTYNGQRFELAALSGSKPQVRCDLVFGSEFGLSHGWVGGNVCFTGYKAVPKREEATPDKVE